MILKEMLGRIDDLLLRREMTASDASRRATGSPDTIRNWRRALRDNRDAGVSTRTVQPVADVLSSNVPWIMEGIGQPDGESNLDNLPVTAPLVTWVSAGELLSDEVSDVAIGTARAVLPPSDWIALRVEGESMDRISPPGSIIFVDRADKRLVTGGFYVIGDGEGHSTYKRFQARPMRFEPVSKNKALPTLYPDNEPTIVGRVKLTTLSL